MATADDLYERAKRTKAGWRLQELRRLYEGFGFDVREGSKHILFIHPDYPWLIATVTRRRTLATGYIQQAVKLIGELKALQQEEREGAR